MRRLLVGQTRDVDSHEHVAKVARKGGYSRVELGGFERCLRASRRRVGDEVELVQEAVRCEAAGSQSVSG